MKKKELRKLNKAQKITRQIIFFYSLKRRLATAARARVYSPIPRAAGHHVDCFILCAAISHTVDGTDGRHSVVRRASDGGEGMKINYLGGGVATCRSTP